MITAIIDERAHGNKTLALTTRTKLILKGFNPDKFTESSPDDPQAIQKLKAVAWDMGIDLGQF